MANLQKRVNAKKLEIHAYGQFRDYAPSVPVLLSLIPKGEGPATESIIEALEQLRDAATNFFTAKLNQALVDLEELELALKAYKQMRSGIIVPGMKIGNA
jgi:hypothetical protein